MKKLLYTSIFILFFVNTFAQFNYQWAQASGNTGAEYGKAVATDINGNVYVTGKFTGTIDFSTSALPHILTSSGGDDIFLLKYDPSGILLYAKKIGGTDDEIPYDILVNDSSVYVVGKFKGTCDFDPSATTNSLTYVGGGTDGDGFVAKYDLSGNYQWAFKIGSTGNDRVLAITGDKVGNIVVSGFFSNTADFDPGNGTANMTSTGYNAFFAKYTPAGTFVFAKQLAGDYSEANDVKIDIQGNIFLLGDFSETMDIDPGPSAVLVSTTSQLNFGIFLAKYSSTGTYIWHKKIAGTGINIPYQIELDATHIYMGGVFSGTNDFDPSGATANLISNGGSDLFFAKYDLTGAYVYAHGVGGTSNDYANGLAIDASSNIYLTGKFSGTNVNFNTWSLGPPTSIVSGNNTGYIVGYNSLGNYIDVQTIGTGASEGRGIHSANGSVYYTGSFQGTVDFDFGPGTMTLTSFGSDDMFISKLNVGGTTDIDNTEKNGVKIFPNPSNGIYYLTLNSNSENTVVEVYNTIGQKIKMDKAEQIENTIDLQELPSGMYFINVLNGEEVVNTFKIIKR